VPVMRVVDRHHLQAHKVGQTLHFLLWQLEDQEQRCDRPG
jgi:hypothetical protein